MADEVKLKSALIDIYPKERAKINIIVTIFSSGIAKEFSKLQNFDELKISSFVSKLENDYGFSHELSKECIKIWIDYYGLSPNKQEKEPIHYELPQKERTSSNKETIKKETNGKKYSIGLKYSENNDGTISITGIGECKDLNIVIPNEINGKIVTSIDNYAFFRCRNLKNIIIPNSVKSIGNYAFQSCHSLTNITILNGVTSIGDYAFWRCRNLTITIPNSVKSIGNYAFLECDSLTSITIPDSVKSIGNYAYLKCDSLTSITIPNSLTNIGKYAFLDCRSLKSIKISARFKYEIKYIFGNLDLSKVKIKYT